MAKKKSANKNVTRKPAQQKPEPGQRKPGRPEIYTDALAEKVLGLIAGGDDEPKSLHEICKEAWAPGHTSVFKWLKENKGFADKYARARELQADWYFDQMDKIARDCGYTHEDIGRARLQIDTLKWKLSKMIPKKYGDKLDVAHEGNLNLKGIIRIPVHPGEGK